jgi:GT2 family glycosyltransferase
LVSIILVGHNGAALLRQCLTSLQAHCQGVRTEVIVVDKASTDASVAMTRASFPSVRVIESAANLGFGKANNLGVRHASGDRLLFLNTDTVFHENAVQALASFLDARPEVGAVGPKLRFEDGSYQLSAGWLPNVASELADKLFYGLDRALHRWMAPLNEALFAGTRTVGWVSGACLMVRRDAFESVGGFDESYFMYFEDRDLCKRLADRGWKVAYHPATSVVHLLAGSSRTVASDVVEGHYRRSHRLYYRKHLGRLQNAVVESYLRATGRG